jgi:amino acid adenylation domain-containing protein
VDRLNENDARSANPGNGQGGNSSRGYAFQAFHPLTSSQREIWFDQLLYGDAPLYNIGGYVRISGGIDPERFERAINLLVQKCDCLRTVLIKGRDDESVPLQAFADEMPINVPLLDFSSHAEPHQAALEWMQERFEESFALYDEKLFRNYLLKIGPECFYWASNYHHLIVDGWTLAMFMRSCGTIYSALEAGELPDLSAPSYLDFIRNDRSYVESEQFQRQRQYWLKKYETLPEPLFAPRYRRQFGDRIVPSESRMLCLPREFYNRLIEFAAANHSTTFHAILGALYVYFARTQQRDDVVMGLPVLNRANAAFKATAGLFVGISATHFKCGTDLSFQELLRGIGEELKQVYRHQRFPLSELNRMVSLRHAGRHQIFDLTVSYERHDYDARFGQAPAHAIPWINSYQQTPLALFVREFHEDEDVWIHFVYNLAHFKGAEIEAIQRRFVDVLQFVMNNVSASVNTIPLLTESERRQAISGWNKTASFPKGKCLHERFETRAALTPDAVAVVCEDQRLSYAELNRRANRLAHRLRELGVKPEQLVGLRIERTFDMVIGIVGILKAGGAYLPLDSAYPKDRMAFMLEDSRVAVVVSQRSLAGTLDGVPVTLVLMDEPLPVADTNPVPQSTADSLAYVMYTSGSTGKPKGVSITHYNVMRLFQATEECYQFDQQDVWSLFHSYAFDFSVWELWGALLYGGRAVVVPYWVSRSPQAFRDLLARERVTVLNQTPSAFRQLVQADLSQAQGDLALRYVIFGGEALELQSLHPWIERHGDVRPLLVNMYGITETTVHVTYRPIRQADLESRQGSVIGNPIPDLQAYILDPNRELVPVGVAGELYVGGAGVARGYISRPELTAERFVPDPFRTDSETKLYRTGDLARRLDDGDIEYLGRIDHQVKVRGFRIELGEIEAGIAAHSAIREVVVLAREDVPGDKRLVAYIVAENTSADFGDQLRAFLRVGLPEYMIPAHFVRMDALPLTENGKVDRRALPAPDALVERKTAYVAPRTTNEEALASIFGEVLGVKQVGVHDNFFELGGHSLIAVRLISRVQAVVGFQLPLRNLFEHPTVAGLAEVIEGLAWMADAKLPTCGAGNREELLL